MQGSFWKTVAVVGVIGVGSLAILEVQHLLSKPGDSQVSAEDEALAKQVVGAGERTVDATLQQSEFEALLSGSDSEPDFDLSEPAFGEPNTNSVVSGAVAARESGKPGVSTQVDISNASDGNPFFAEEKAAAAPVSANEVQTVGFTESADEENPFELLLQTDESETANVAQEPTNSGGQPFRRDDVASADSTPDEGFTLFAEDAPNTPSPAQNTAREPAKSSTPEMKFFGAEEPTETAATTGSELPARTTQFYESDPQPLRPTPDAAGDTPPSSRSFEADPISFEDSSSETFESDSGPTESPASQPAATPREPEPFDEIIFDDDAKTPALPIPDAISDAAPRDNRETTEEPFSEDLVPAPRGVGGTPGRPDMTEPGFSTPGFSDADDGTRSFPGSVPTDADFTPSVPAASDTDSGSFSDSSLPFAEDIGTPTTSDSPSEFPEAPSLNIPDRSFGDIPGTRSDRESIPALPDSGMSDSFDADPSTGFSENELSITPRPAPRRDRTFDSGTGRIRDDGIREFGIGGPDPGAPRFGSEDRGTRQVSGVMRPNMVLQKTAPKNATVGTPLDYKIYVRNEGDATAYEVVVEDEVTAGATVDGTRPKSVIDRSTNRLIWNFDEIGPGETKEITVQVTPTGEGTLDGVATVRFKARVKATTVITAPKLRLQMTGPEDVRLGEEVAYRYVITNEGTGEARNVFVRTVLPAGGGLKHPAGNDLEYEIESLRPNEQREITLKVVAAEPGEHRAEAEVSGTGGAKDQAAWRTNVVGAQLTIIRRGPKRRFVGRPATYENLVSNETNFDAVDAKVVEQIPDGMKFVSANLGARYDDLSRTVTWRVNRIGAGRQETLQIELMPTAAGARESVVTVYENAGIQSEGHVSTTVVEDLHNVSADISQLDGPVAVGETFGFTIAVDNRGTADATDVELAVDVPKEIRVVGAGSRQIQARLLEGNTVQYNVVIRIPPGQKQNFELKLQGSQPVRNGAVRARVKYAQMEEPLIVSESVTVYEDL